MFINLLISSAKSERLEGLRSSVAVNTSWTGCKCLCLHGLNPDTQFTNMFLQISAARGSFQQVMMMLVMLLLLMMMLLLLFLLLLLLFLLSLVVLLVRQDSGGNLGVAKGTTLQSAADGKALACLWLCNEGTLWTANVLLNCRGFSAYLCGHRVRLVLFPRLLSGTFLHIRQARLTR